jgi:hypothetical protein
MADGGTSEQRQEREVCALNNKTGSITCVSWRSRGGMCAMPRLGARIGNSVSVVKLTAGVS